MTQIEKDALVLLKTQERDAAAAALAASQAAAAVAAAALTAANAAAAADYNVLTAAQAALDAALAIVVADPPPGSGTFTAVITKLPTAYSVDPALDTECENTTWTNFPYDLLNDCHYSLSWQGRIESIGGQAPRQWKLRTGVLGVGVHNRTLAYDPINHRLWIGSGTGEWYVPGTTTKYVTSPPMVYIDLAKLDAFPNDPVQWFITFPFPAAFGSEAAAHFDPVGQRFVIFGGWGNLTTRTMPLNPPGPYVVVPAYVGPKWSYTLPGSEPSFVAVQRMCSWSSGVDKRGRSIYVEPRGRVWVLPHTTLQFALLPTTGDLPPQQSHSTIDADLDCIVNWASGDGVPGGSAGNPVNELRVCPLDTLEWTKIAYTGPVPVIASYVSVQLTDDPSRAQQLLHITGGNWGNLHTYTIKVTQSFDSSVPGNGGTPPTDPPLPPSVPTISNARATPSSLPVGGGAVVIDATVTDATTVTVGGLEVTLPTLPIMVTASRTFPIVVTGPGGTATASVTVPVALPASPPPPPPPVPLPDPVPPGSTTGVLTSLALLNVAGSPYRLGGNSKHTNMAGDVNDHDLLYVEGGDWSPQGSAADGTWRYNLKTGEAVQIVPLPVYPTLPAPHALQDGSLFAWSTKRLRFVRAPGSYFPYFVRVAGLAWPTDHDKLAATYPLLNYSLGAWYFDPYAAVPAKAYEHEPRLFPVGGTTGNLFGGLLDDANDTIVAFGDASGGYVVKRWSLATCTRLPDVKLPVARKTSAPAAYFGRGQHVLIDDYAYVIGYRTNGMRAGQVPMMFRVKLDGTAYEELPPPPVDGTLMAETEIRIGTSNGKLVWPFTDHLNGWPIRSINVYDPAKRTWAVDNQRPASGNFVGNSVCSLPDGRVAWCGTVFGKMLDGSPMRQTHMFFYRAA